MTLRLCLFVFAVALAGCESVFTTETPKTATVSANPFGLPALGKTTKANVPLADEAVATRVDAIGRKLLAANPQLGLGSVLFATIGKAPQAELFHVDTSMVYVTEGLVARCRDDAELAAVLAFALGRMVVERESAATPAMRRPDKLPPMDVPLGNVGQRGDADLSHQFELARYEKDRPRSGRALPKPRPEELARQYLAKAGYPAQSFESVRPLLQEAEANVGFERQIKGLAPAGHWTP
ncbi:MAG: hypothetical protein NZO58_03720 [Gemmataceae bacterium]|nr:hypothetical protein [Gemmataceae bacterium]